MRSLLCVIGNLLSIVYAKVFLITVVRRTTNMPQGPKIFVVNHPNTLDPFYLLGILRERVSILIIRHVFHIPVLGVLIRRAGHINVTERGHEVYAQAKKTLRAGRSLLLFAEGEISYGACNLRKFHTGAVRLSLETGAPIIPIGIHLDQNKIWKRKTMIKNQSLVVTWYRYGWYTVVFGEPLYIKGTSANRVFVRKETITLRKHVISCINQAKQASAEDQLLHKRTAKRGFHIALRGVYKFVCFVGFIVFRLNEVGIKILG
ncbi:MAG: lysophospholipid acyltransferase family protein [Candidatus Gottesmanbacteria bacterium]